MPSNEALIVSKRIIPSHQLATLMEDNDFYPRVDYGKDAHNAKLVQCLSLLVVDIDDPDIKGLEIARQYLSFKPGMAWFALCEGGNTAAMQQARAMMVGGFFFLSESGMALDCKRGVAQFLDGCSGAAINHGRGIRGRVGNMQHRPTIALFKPYYT